MSDEESVARKASRLNDPKVSSLLMMATFIVGGAGIALGFYGWGDTGAARGLHLSFPLMVGAVGILSFVRHSLFYRSDAIRISGTAGEPFFIIELGFANGAIGAVALLVFFATWGTAAEVALTLIYALYLLLAFFLFAAARIKRGGLNAGVALRMFFWFLQLGFMFLFAIAAWVSAGL
jgi:hypothetical protein